MKDKKIVGTVEKLVLGDVEIIDDSIQIFIGIKEVSDNLHSRIIQAMEENKIENIDIIKRMYGRGWNETEVKELTLNIIANKDKSLKTSILVYFEEKDNPDIYDTGEFEIDLSGYEMELKALIIKGITNKFF